MSSLGRYRLQWISRREPDATWRDTEPTYHDTRDGAVAAAARLKAEGNDIVVVDRETGEEVLDA